VVRWFAVVEPPAALSAIGWPETATGTQLPPLVVVVGVVVGGAVVGGAVVGGAVVAVVGGSVACVVATVVGAAVVAGGWVGAAVAAVLAGAAVVAGAAVGAAVGATVAGAPVDSLDTGAVVAGPAAVACVSAGAAVSGAEVLARGSSSVPIPPAPVTTAGAAPPDSSKFGPGPMAALVSAVAAAPRSDAARLTSASDSASDEMAHATTTYDVTPTAPMTVRVRRAGWVR
jgi:hypothetical protein